MSNFFELYMSPLVFIVLAIGAYVGYRFAHNATTAVSALFILCLIASMVIDIVRFFLNDMLYTYLIGAGIGLVLYLIVVFTVYNLSFKIKK